MTKVFDFHTHILPGVDDGSRSVEESLEMISALSAQGAWGIAATPHFYAQRSSPERFFQKRDAAWERLSESLGEDAPEIRLGAEVQYFEGIHRCGGLEDFCITGTNLLLVEMPMGEWTNRMVSAVLEVNSRGSTRVLLAHIERYMSRVNNRYWDEFLDNGVLIQASTEFFIQKRWTSMRLLRQGKIHVLGTDSHNMGSRKPNLAQALDTIGRKNGEELLRELSQREALMLNETENYFNNY